ncbi:MAG: hypothetical protein ILP23_03715, partial [Paludibacteraceae bacterium]|nr:hypothetical protein [Paludibacteraceae bacterium]
MGFLGCAAEYFHKAEIVFLCPLWFGRLTNQAQCSGAEAKEKKLKLPFGCAHGAVFDILCPLWFGRLTTQAPCSGAEVKGEKGSYPSAMLRV